VGFFDVGEPGEVIDGGMELVLVIHTDTYCESGAAWGAHGDTYNLAKECAKGGEVACVDVCLTDGLDVRECQGDKLGHQAWVGSAKADGPSLSAFDADTAAAAASVCGGASL